MPDAPAKPSLFAALVASLRRLVSRLRKRETPAQRLGRWGERLAARHLRRKGYRIVGRRIRPGPRAEIDIVALGRDRGGPFIAFVEVKTRAGDDFGGPVAALDDEKRRALRRAARLYLRRLSGAPVRHRFDLVAVVGSPDSREKPVVQHFENAFRFDDAVQAQWL